jgi:hypothetical protein
MATERGRPPIHWADKARLWAWYWTLREVGISDYQLDLQFAWTKEQRETGDGSERPRVFDHIRKSARVPSNRGNCRSLDEIMQAVEEDERFAGAKAIYEAQLWDLFKTEALDVEQSIERLALLFTRHGLRQIDPTALPFAESRLKIGEVKFFVRCTIFSTYQLPVMDAIAILWLLYLQSWHAENWEIRNLLESWLDHHLDKFFFAYLTHQDSQKFYLLATQAMKRARLTASERQAGSLHYVGKRSAWGILQDWPWSEMTAEDLKCVIDYLHADCSPRHW